MQRQEARERNEAVLTKRYVSFLQDTDNKIPKYWALTDGDAKDSYQYRRDKYSIQSPLAPLSGEIVTQLHHYQQHHMQGVFSDIHRVWMTFDSRLYIWDINGGDFCCFSELEEVIVGVGLVRPKPGIYDESIQYLLVLSTPLMVYMIGVELRGDDMEELELNNALLHTTATDNVCMTAITGTPSGRVFMGGNDGCIYEVQYERESGWLRRKCRKINHTQPLWSLLLPTVVSESWGFKSEPILQLEINPQGTHVFARTASTVVGYRIDATTLHRVVTAYNDEDRKGEYSKASHGTIISISPFDNEHVLAITTKGIRVYMTARTCYIRKPPMEGEVSSAHFSNGTLLLSYVKGARKGQAGANAALVMITQDLLKLASAAATTKSKGNSIKTREIVTEFVFPEDDADVYAIANMMFDADLRMHNNKLVSQHLPPSEFVLLTTKGTFSITDFRPVDLIKSALPNMRDMRFISDFFTATEVDVQSTTPKHLELMTHARRREACAATIAAICHPGQGISIDDIARAILSYGGTPASVVTAAQHQPGAIGQATQQSNVAYSGRHDAFFSVLGRFCTTFRWRDPIFHRDVSGTKHYLRLLIDVVHQTYPPLHQQHAAVTASDAEAQEHASIRQLLSLIEHIHQVQELWALMQDTPDLLTSVTADLPAEDQSQLRRISLWDLGTSDQGVKLAKRMINTMLNRFITNKDSQRFERMTATLHTLCPLLHSSREMLESQARSELAKASRLLSSPGANKELNFKNAQPHLQKVVNAYERIFNDEKSSFGLAEISKKLIDLGDLDGVTKLALSCAAVPRLAVARDFYYGKTGAHDRAAESALEERNNCYAQICKGLSALLTSEQEASQSKYAGTLDDVVKQVVVTDDELAHIAIFTWLYENRQDMRLFKISSPYMEKWLDQQIQANRDNTEALLQIYQVAFGYYREHEKYTAKLGETALALATLSFDSRTFEERYANLVDGIQFLEDGQNHLTRHAQGAPRAQHILSSLRMHREYAELQAEIITALAAKPPTADIELALRELNSQFFSADLLVANYAAPFDLHECVLTAILEFNVDCDKTRDDLWRAILHDAWEHANRSGEGVTDATARALVERVCSIISRMRGVDSAAPSLLAQWIEEFFLQQSTLSDTFLLARSLHELAGLSWAEVFHNYHRLNAEAQSELRRASQPLHYVVILTRILTEWRHASHGAHDAELTSIIRNQVQDLIASAATEASGAPIKRELEELARYAA